MTEDLTKHTLNLFRGDYEKLAELYPDVGAAPVIRRIIRNYLKSLDQPNKALPSTEVNL